ncbi:beta-L-arabinofuranosidase domain-containing protein [Alteriqipengyuania lutimaris]|nr:beta-L-arabinofuranosidase domain-containing protein [Alteriqipengyuania lutimaris]MBB3035561.1 hypothetical protein [Alteriqipengyuania lutimaris]
MSERPISLTLNRRTLLAGASALSLAGATGRAMAWGRAPQDSGPKLSAAPLPTVTLLPSIFADAQAANRTYLASLDPERFLHNFYLSAGLEAPKPAYGGWESKGIAGHSLGHWLSAVAMIIANTGDSELMASLDHCLSEMALIQQAHGDGYCGGTTVERDGEILDGKVVFEEIRRGEIRSGGFDLNGGWVPLYSWHKIHAGLIDVHRLVGHTRAMPIMLGLADYLGTILEGLDDAQLQRVLDAEHRGLNEAYADTFALMGKASQWRAELGTTPTARLNRRGQKRETGQVVTISRTGRRTARDPGARRRRAFRRRRIDHTRTRDMGRRTGHGVACARAGEPFERGGGYRGAL